MYRGHYVPRMNPTLQAIVKREADGKTSKKENLYMLLSHGVFFFGDDCLEGMLLWGYGSLPYSVLLLTLASAVTLIET